MTFSNIKYILTDIEGTTSSISFVADELFPYFRKNIHVLKSLKDNETVKQAYEETILLSQELENKTISSDDEIIDTLYRWSMEDKKYTPLKAVQGVLWENGYKSGELKGHVYPEVKDQLEKWSKQNIQLGVFSSGSIAAQKLIFGYSVSGDLTPYFSNYFDTKTGTKRDVQTYSKIAEILSLNPTEILFLSDIYEELEAADLAGFQTIQLVREEIVNNWKFQVSNFKDIKI
ncbi:MAG: acireductone synthase [Fluviicola sp.]